MNLMYAMVNSEGEVVRSMSPGYSQMMPDRSTHDGLLVIHVDEMEIKDVSTIYWDFETSKFKSRERKKSPYDKWEGKKWKTDTKRLMKELRVQRTSKLIRSDWTQVGDAPLTEVQKELWRVYRQALRDITEADLEGLTDLDDFQWPQAPGE